ncbi:cell wall binding repeat 2 family protein [Clostridium sporogenes]|uniref:cell wall-binding repeat-containing protein n=1 Tax=Clostridium TaxID=1485 RepID=UPI0009097E76|nr:MULTISPECIES: cell wall-binding repeat-containing protein [Clostridium]APF28009.1 cell wall binding repeat 2 family protein [Clostridium sporogenes]MDI6918049.1 cell wall-binding repeat-containing protein [Clostridium botulinum]WMU96291.1 cell wall-binding repeat-containing protein [Clostridium botulinum]
MKSKKLMTLMLTVGITCGLLVGGTTSVNAEDIVVNTRVDDQMIVNRLFGSNRYETNLEILKKFGATDTIIIASGENFPDAISATPLCKKYNAPLMLVNDDLTGLQQSFIYHNGIKKAIIVGGSSVVNKDIEGILEVSDISVRRLGGRDRYDTCEKVASEMGKNNGFIIVNGGNFPDALSASSVASAMGVPILITPKDNFPQYDIQAVPKNSTFVIGGEGVVSDKIKDDYCATRISGKDRYETNLAVMKQFRNLLDFKHTYVASGQDFPDALSASALASSIGSPLVLAPYQVGKDATDLIDSMGCKNLTLIGGIGVLDNYKK